MINGLKKTKQKNLLSEFHHDSTKENQIAGVLKYHSYQ